MARRFAGRIDVITSGGDVIRDGMDRIAHQM